MSTKQLAVNGSVRPWLLASEGGECLLVKRSVQNQLAQLLEALPRLGAHSDRSCRQPQRLRQHALQVAQPLGCGLAAATPCCFQLSQLLLLRRAVLLQLCVHGLRHALTAGAEDRFATFDLIRV